MEIEDVACRARGFVSPSWIDVSTGRRMEFCQRHNTLSYMSAEAMASAFGGDPSYIPARVGFIYGDSDTLPNALSSPITRSQSWGDLKKCDGYDILVVGFSYSPTLGYAPANEEAAKKEDDYTNYNKLKAGGSNATTFHVVSNSTDAGIGGSTWTAGTGYVYQAVLLGYHAVDDKTDPYYILSRVSLDDNGSYKRKPSGFEVALDWTIAFG